MKQIEVIAVLSVESDEVRFTVVSTRDGSEVVTSAETFTLITAESKDRRGGRNCESSDQQSVAAVSSCVVGTPTPATNVVTDGGVSYTAERESPMSEGDVEQDPDVVWEAVLRVIGDALDKMCRDGIPVTYIKSVAIINEMATLVAWNAATGKAVHNFIHWTDVRMAEGGTAAAVKWLLQRSLAVQCAADDCRFGTLDAWLTWKLTRGHTYQTDVTNASYTGLLDLATLSWDFDAMRSHGLAPAAWPAIRRLDKRSASVIVVDRLYGLSIHVTMARPSAVLYAQACYRRGQVAVTLTDRTAVVLGAYDHGPPRLQPTLGPWPVVGYCEPNMADRRRPTIVYGLLAVSRASAVVCWLKNMGLTKSWDDCMNTYASGRPTMTEHQAYMVPAFGGLPSAPYGRSDARPVVCGIGGHTGRVHLIAAAVDSICHSVNDIVRCVVAGSSSKLADPVYVDGQCAELGGLMQRLADVSGSRLAVKRLDMAVSGAARMAAAAINVDYADRLEAVDYEPTSTDGQRLAWDGQWAKAVRRSYGWVAMDGRELDDRYAKAHADKQAGYFGISQLANLLRRVGFWYNRKVYDLLYALRNYLTPNTPPHNVNTDSSLGTHDTTSCKM
ncbi:glycerol kinase 2-like [Metopolophium dirhodum]|uniref:glycerol kinase 2-like n=1 Tax=Metopolophium dirhodum TaxID=44670 RepID=UPI00298FF5AB|nr:glycerol kinase 2-like [Metopolophium dirhodum]